MTNSKQFQFKEREQTDKFKAKKGKIIENWETGQRPLNDLREKSNGNLAVVRRADGDQSCSRERNLNPFNEKSKLVTKCHGIVMKISLRSHFVIREENFVFGYYALSR